MMQGMEMNPYGGREYEPYGHKKSLVCFRTSDFQFSLVLS